MAEKVVVVTEQATWDAAKAAGEHYQKRRRLGEGQVLAKKYPTTDLVKVKNDTGSSRRAGDVLEVGDPLVDDEDLTNEFLWFGGGAPTGGDKFGILRKPLPDGEIGELQVSGVCKAWVNVTDTAHTHAKPVASSHALESGESGPLVILHNPGGTGEKNCTIVFRGDGGGEDEDPPDPCASSFTVPIEFELDEETCDIVPVLWKTVSFDEHGCITEAVTDVPPEEE